MLRQCCLAFHTIGAELRYGDLWGKPRKNSAIFRFATRLLRSLHLKGRGFQFALLHVVWFLPAITLREIANQATGQARL